jgi:NAD dependent epimerase/dehydratase
MDLQGSKVLVTGADGFIGSHLVEALLAEKASVRALVCYNSFNSWGWLDDFPEELLTKIEVISGDIRDPNCVKKLMEGIDVAFHLAALIAIPYSYAAPDSYVDTNIKGTLNVLQSARELGTTKVLVTSTSEVYGTAKYVPIDETHPFQGQSPYSATKIGADRVAESFHRSFGLPVTIVRPFNTYGPRQSARAVIPTIISQLLSGSRQIKLGSLSPTRDLVFVKDTARAFVEIAKKDNLAGEEINVATQREISIGDLARRIMSLMEIEAEIIGDNVRVRPKDSEVERLLGSNEKIKRLVGWQPDYDLDEGLAHTISWFKSSNRTHSYKADIYNV